MSDRVIAYNRPTARMAHLVAPYALLSNGPSVCGKAMPWSTRRGWITGDDAVLDRLNIPLCKFCQRIDARTVMSDGTNAAD